MDKPCKHHWMIAPPSGPTSTGRCKLCGEEREFKNSTKYDTWEETRRHSVIIVNERTRERRAQ